MNKNFIKMLIESGLKKDTAISVAKIVDSEFRSRMELVDKRVNESLKEDIKAIDKKLYESLKSDLFVLLTKLDEQYELDLQAKLNEQKEEHKAEFKLFLEKLDSKLVEKYGDYIFEEDESKIMTVSGENTSDEEIKDLVDQGYKVVSEEDEEEIEIPETEEGQETEVPEVAEVEVETEDGEVEVESEEDIDAIDDLETAKELLANALEEIEALRAEIEAGVDSEEGSAFDDFEDFEDFEDYAADQGFEGEDGDLDFLWERKEIFSTKEELDEVLKESTAKYKAKKLAERNKRKALKESKKVNTKTNKQIKDVDSSVLKRNRSNVSTILESSSFGSNSIDDIYIPTKFL